MLSRGDVASQRIQELLGAFSFHVKCDIYLCEDGIQCRMMRCCQPTPMIHVYSYIMTCIAFTG